MNMKTLIDQLIEKHKYDQKRFYWLIQANTTNMGDESELSTYCWKSNVDYSKNNLEDELESLDILNAEILKLQPEEEGYELKIEQNETSIWTNEYNDSIHIQITDHSLYLIIMKSGQY